MKYILILVAAAASFMLMTFAALPAQEKKEEKKAENNLNRSEQLAQEYLDSFQQTGIPTPNAIAAAFKKADESPSIGNWEVAAKMANSFANVVDVLKDHLHRPLLFLPLPVRQRQYEVLKDGCVVRRRSK